MPETSESEATLDDSRFGAIAVWGGLVSSEALEEALAAQSAARASGPSSGEGSPRLGEMLVERGHLTDEQVRRVLKVQLQRLPAERHLVFGRTAGAHGFVSSEENRRALDVQAREILAGGEVRPLADILMAMGAIDREAADAIISYQAKGDSTHMSKTRKARAEGETVPGTVCAQYPSGRPGKRFLAPFPPAPGPRQPPEAEDAPRPVFLPRGALGFISDHSTWLAVAAAVLFALVLIVFKERIFGATRESRTAAEAGAASPAD